MGFTAKDQSIYDLFNRNCYRIPKNQRKYVWKTRNLQELYDDIIIVAKGFEQSHFIGSIVLSQEKDRENGVSVYKVIDGQQRITTLSVFIASIGYWLKYYNSESEFNGLKKYLIARDDSNNDHIIVSLEEHMCLESITRSIINASPTELKTKDKNVFIVESAMNYKDDKVVKAFLFFIEKISEELKSVNDNPIDYLKKLRDVLLHKIRYVHIIAAKEEDAYTIFEILNARGTLLEDHELLKNYIMRGLEHNNDINTVRNAWSALERNLKNSIHRFFYHYTIHKYKGNSKDYDGYSDYKVIKENSKGQHTYTLLEDIVNKSNLYKRLIDPQYRGCEKNCTQEEYKLFSFLKSRRQEQFRPLLLSLIHQYSLGNISDKNYTTVLSFLYVFFICFNIIGEETSNRLSNIVNSKAYELENKYSDDLLLELVDKLCNKLPDRNIFINEFRHIGWSHHGNYYDDEKLKYRVQLVLEIFECYNNPNDNCGEFTIEHIIDDDKKDDYAKIGNLIPLEARLNQQCAGKSFEEKLIIYKASSFSTARLFAERYQGKNFGLNEIELRSGKMAEKFFDSIFEFKNTDAIIKKIKIPKGKSGNNDEFEQISFNEFE